MVPNYTYYLHDVTIFRLYMVAYEIILIVVNLIYHDHINCVTLYSPYSWCHIIHMIYIGYHMEHIIYKVTIYTDLIYTYKIIYGVTLYKSCKECHALHAVIL